MAPPIVFPAELATTADDVFHDVDRSVVPELADVLDLLAERYPLVLAAIKDVDRSLIWSMMENTPLENLESCGRMARDIAELHDAGRRKPAT
jgi:hypothetical protein